MDPVKARGSPVSGAFAVAVPMPPPVGALSIHNRTGAEAHDDVNASFDGAAGGACGNAVDTLAAVMAATGPSTSSSSMLQAGAGAAAAGVAAAPYVSSMMQARDRICFQHFLFACGAVLATCTVLLVLVWRATAADNIDAATGKVRPYSFQFFVCCLAGGVVAGLVHLVVTPIDVVKCRVQVGEYRSFREGFVQLYRVEAGGSVRRAVPLFFRGWLPTLWGYCIQGALKFSLYEIFKYVLLISPMEASVAAAQAAGQTNVKVKMSGVYQFSIFLLASCLAEVLADLGLAPWEAVKIRMQTSAAFPVHLRASLPRMWETEGLHGFYKGLVPLWCRQVPYTMMKFSSFEFIVVALTNLFHALSIMSAEEEPSVLAKLVVSLLAGVLAGLLCGLVSHPADTVLSKMNQRSSAAANTSAPLLANTIAAARSGGNGGAGALSGVVEIVRELGWRGLWKGLAPRLLMVCSLTALQWVTYDGFKVWAGLPTSGGVKH